MRLIKSKTFQIVTFSVTAFLLHAAASCNKKGDDNPDPATCNGPGQVAVSGTINY
ncbi:MAG: hypothetical protein PHG67_07335 [Bacteroidales bacterium]|jgi:hypothetical protein|nr:hypothetical protein [Bacteroidales bacterium]